MSFSIVYFLECLTNKPCHHLVNTYLVFELHRRRPCGSWVDHLRVILYLFFLVSSSAEMHSRFDQRHLVSYSVQRLLIHILQFQERHWPSNQYEMLRFFFFSSVLTYSSWREHLFISCHHGNWFFFFIIRPVVMRIQS